MIFSTDANATSSDEEHNATLIGTSAIFADVMNTSQPLRLIGRSDSTRMAV